MSANLIAEGLVPVRKLCKDLPGNRGAEKLNPATAWRWCLRGVRRRDGKVIKLEHVRVGSQCCSTPQALARFFARLSECDTDTGVSPTPTPSAKKRVAEQCNKTLEEMLA